MSYNTLKLPSDLQHRADHLRPISPGAPTAGLSWPFPPAFSPGPVMSELKLQSLRAQRSSEPLITPPPPSLTASLDTTNPASTTPDAWSDNATSPSTGLAGLIEPGTYVAFQLCPSMITELYPHAAEAIHTFQYKKFVGLVTDAFIHLDESPLEEGKKARYVQDLVVHYVSAVPTDPVVLARVPMEDLANRIPIYPASAVPSDAEGQDQGQDQDQEQDEEEVKVKSEPLRTMTLFPWANCHQWTTLGIRLMVLVEHLHDSSLKFALHEEEFERFNDVAARDLQRPPPVTESIGVNDSANDSSSKVTGPETHDEDSDVASDGPPNSEEGDAEVAMGDLRVGDHSVPAEVWMDVREAYPDARDDPIGFPREIMKLLRPDDGADDDLSISA
ncbi:uncharacterized protein STEHIDRAFT_114856 [Stereum hirsutum FP-91666 SS1]|uniref:uncharacterized protein n=1 Tax=Stereum hirsutum (strain FP-91666) TaxID=721885 RepID=UPI0004449586|nr:uncharacterized protein STEHIDRAFT_114856 [Stereum hirsutum FP-91666 SS1]EIM81400.1 hypothetical protein STEHIDRAFT_114856 [Stereum hirsutum FP-91666 SS1]